ncbi:hypothetical protein LUZ62_081064 [Rhynchospora pubera]|uniref:Uncharacterized protein n=1 Tax=Rhynchospora pubera TaxID=906938 RepID=A0AAV8BUJ8_9POAL|nr:hypothetical protein LUZ62_081064 [Rhynchospora pubera]
METKLPKRRQLAMPADTIERLHAGRVVSQEEVDGAVRVKILLSKKELKKMVASLRQRQSTGNIDCQRKATTNKPNTGDQQSFEQMLHVLRKRHVRRVAAAAAKGGQLSEWQPALQSIPEES